MDWTGAADLEGSIRKWEDDRRYHVAMIEAIDSDLAGMRVELERRNIEAFWGVNKGLRLNVGDSVMITKEAVEKFGGSSGSIGRVLRIVEFNLKNSMIESVGFGVRSVVPLDIARRMREAYLLTAHPQPD